MIRPAINNMIKNYYENRIVLEGGDQNAIQEQLINEIIKMEKADQRYSNLLQEYLSEKQSYV